VAVVIPCRDHGYLIIEAIASVERSIPEPYELIIVDDGSQDPGTVEIMAPRPPIPSSWPPIEA